MAAVLLARTHRCEHDVYVDRETGGIVKYDRDDDDDDSSGKGRGGHED